jgi:hypothetical protein
MRSKVMLKAKFKLKFNYLILLQNPYGRSLDCAEILAKLFSLLKREMLLKFGVRLKIKKQRRSFEVILAFLSPDRFPRRLS